MKELSTAQLDRWCKTATEQIRFGPDRRRVAEELRNHLEDHRMSLIEQGMDQQEANLQALEAMGSAEELAPQLAAIHKPFWGRVIRICRILLVPLLVFSIFPMINYYGRSLAYSAPDLEELYPDSYVEENGLTVQHLSPAKVSFSSDGSTFTVTDAMILTDQYGNTELQILVEQRCLLPSLEQVEYMMRYIPITEWFYVTDSAGTQYVPYHADRYSDNTFLSKDLRFGLFSCTMRYRIFDFVPDNVQWVDLSYARDGRSYTLRVDLTGGAAE